MVGVCCNFCSKVCRNLIKKEKNYILRRALRLISVEKMAISVAWYLNWY